MQSWIPFVPDSASTLSWKVDALYFYLSGVTLFFTLADFGAADLFRHSLSHGVLPTKFRVRLPVRISSKHFGRSFPS